MSLQDKGLGDNRVKKGPCLAFLRNKENPALNTHLFFCFSFGLTIPIGSPNTIDLYRSSQSAFYVNLYRAVIGPSG